ncbi:hypothetical protein RRG08_044201 [Elysia crispata]|uniref:Uncharacterized protein n=1 Tax=Elysia crispata TaxID=231223 RepID=A0AAE0XWW3_9GAST|nr:hypothetical protein RRG08_044201 [Elysia crispata]
MKILWKITKRWVSLFLPCGNKTVEIILRVIKCLAWKITEHLFYFPAPQELFFALQEEHTVTKMTRSEWLQVIESPLSPSTIPTRPIFRENIGYPSEPQLLSQLCKNQDRLPKRTSAVESTV